MKKLFRNKSNSIIGGVCSGIADYLDIDPVLIRLIFIIGGIFLTSITLITYFLLWIFIPSLT